MTRNRQVNAVSIAMALVMVLSLMAGCGKAAPAPIPEEETPQPAVTELTLRLTGVLTETVTLSAFEAGAKCHGAVRQVKDEDGATHSYSGIPLWLLCGRVDDEVKHGSDAFNDELANQGYIITVISADGHTATFDSRVIARNDSIIVAYKVDGQLLSVDKGPLKLVGLELKGGDQIEDVIEIHLDLQSAQ